MNYIIVGAGILGASTAYHLAKSGANVTIIDRKDKGQATFAASGIVCPWLTQRRNKAWYFLAKNGARYYPELIKNIEDKGHSDTGYAKVGAISLHHDISKLDKMEERAYLRLKDAPEIGKISRLIPSETQLMFPPLADGYHALHVSGAARINGRALLQGLIKAAMAYGAKIIHGDAKLIASGNEGKGVEVEGQKVYADIIIITAGAWASSLLQPLGLVFKVKPQKAQIIHLQLSLTNTNHWPVVMPPNNQYILAFPNGKIIVGATHEDDAGFDTKATAGGVADLLSKALSIAPGLEQSALKEIRVGFRPVAPGFLPILGFVPGYNNIIVANGLGASGLTVGPYLGSQLALLVQGKKVEINIEDYDASVAFDSDQR